MGSFFSSFQNQLQNSHGLLFLFCPKSLQKGRCLRLFLKCYNSPCMGLFFRSVQNPFTECDVCFCSVQNRPSSKPCLFPFLCQNYKNMEPPQNLYICTAPQLPPQTKYRCSHVFFSLLSQMGSHNVDVLCFLIWSKHAHARIASTRPAASVPFKNSHKLWISASLSLNLQSIHNPPNVCFLLCPPLRTTKR